MAGVRSATTGGCVTALCWGVVMSFLFARVETAGRGRRSADVAHHVLDPGVLLEPVHRKVLAVTGVAVAAVRHLRDERQVRVDPDGAEVQPPGHPQGTSVVLRPDTRAQAVAHVVCPAYGVVLVV